MQVLKLVFFTGITCQLNVPIQRLLYLILIHFKYFLNLFFLMKHLVVFLLFKSISAFYHTEFYTLLMHGNRTRQTRVNCLTKEDVHHRPKSKSSYITPIKENCTIT